MSSRRSLLIGAVALGVAAATVGIGASIAGLDDRSDDPVSTTAPPGAGASAPAVPAEAEEEPGEEAPGEEPGEEDEAAEEAAEARLEAEAAVSRAEAEQIAQGQVAGPVDRARISDEGGTVTSEVRIDTDGGHTDVVIDATTGAVLEVDD